MATKTTTITGHLKELRSRLIKSVVFLLLAFIICFIFADNIYAFLLDPYVQATKNDPMQRRMIFTALHETFLTYLKLAFFSAFCLFFVVQGYRSRNPVSVKNFSILCLETSYE